MSATVTCEHCATTYLTDHECTRDWHAVALRLAGALKGVRDECNVQPIDEDGEPYDSDRSEWFIIRHCRNVAANALAAEGM